MQTRARVDMTSSLRSPEHVGDLSATHTGRDRNILEFTCLMLSFGCGPLCLTRRKSELDTRFRRIELARTGYNMVRFVARQLRLASFIIMSLLVLMLRNFTLYLMRTFGSIDKSGLFTIATNFSESWLSGLRRRTADSIGSVRDLLTVLSIWIR